MAATTAAFVLTVVGTAVATHITGHVTRNGGTEVEVVTQTMTTPRTTKSQTFVTVPGTDTTITVPSGESREITARFVGESQCVGGAKGSHCSMQVAAAGAGGVLFLHPDAGSDYAFDSVSTRNDYWESHAMERVARLGSGTWTITAQWRTSTASTTFRLDDWAFTVELNA